MNPSNTRVQRSVAHCFATASDKLQERLDTAMKAASIAQGVGLSVEKIENLPMELASNFLGEVTLRALSIEVGLKYLVQAAGKAPPRSHELDKLWDRLPKSIQDELAVAAGVKSSIELEKAIRANRTPFVDWRYCYEGVTNASTDVQFLRSMSRAVGFVAERH